MNFLQLIEDECVVNVQEISYARSAVAADHARPTVPADAKTVIAFRTGMTLYAATPYDEVLAALWLTGGES